MTIDDSALLHGGTYDPVKAREYYLRTRQLKGRKTGRQEVPSSSRRGSSQGGSFNTTKSAQKTGRSRQEELRAQRDALEKRLDRLRAILAQKVKAAKARSGIDEKADPKETAAKNESKKKDTPLTAAQKREKAKKARERYEKEKDQSLSEEIKQLQKQIQDIREKIQKAVEDARKKSAQSKNQTAPKGR